MNGICTHCKQITLFTKTLCFDCYQTRSLMRMWQGRARKAWNDYEKNPQVYTRDAYKSAQANAKMYEDAWRNAGGA